MIDARIALGVQPPQFESPVNALAKVMQLKGLQQEQQLGQMKMQEYERGTQEQNALRSVLGGQGFDWSNADMRNRAMAASPSKATEMYKAHVEATDKAGQTRDREFKQAEKGYELANSRLAAWRDRPDLTKQGLVSDMGTLVTWGLMRPEALKLFEGLPDDVNVLRSEIDRGLKSGLTAEQKLKMFAPNPVRQDSGQRIDTIDDNPNSPTFQKVLGTTQKQATPGDLLTDARGKEQLAISRGQLGVSQGQLGIARENARIAGERLGLERTKEAREAGADRTSGGPVLGVPTPTVLPWQNQSNPKDANKVKAQEISRGAKEIEKDMDAARKAAATAARAARFIELNKEKATGGALDKVPGGQWAQSFGDKYSEMLSITSELAPAMREPGSGASSDMDVKMFKDATVSVEKPGKTNENIAKAIIARSQQAQEYADFRQTYLEQNGTLQGADRYWKDYVNKNPIFKPESKEYELNPKRKAWADHFKASDKPAAAPAPAPGGGLSAAEKAELEALRKQLGRK
jgi:hypothetical protein